MLIIGLCRGTDAMRLRAWFGGYWGEIFALGCFENLKKQVRYGCGLAGVKNNG